jgi:hypothetical protein
LIQFNDGVNGRTHRDTWVREADYAEMERKEFNVRRRQANLCDAVMARVVDLEKLANPEPGYADDINAVRQSVSDAAKKLRAAVVANT